MTEERKSSKEICGTVNADKCDEDAEERKLLIQDVIQTIRDDVRRVPTIRVVQPLKPST